MPPASSGAPAPRVCRLLPLALLALVLASAGRIPAQDVVRVPQDTADLGVAIQRVADGGVVEVAAGVYAPPARGWVVRAASKSFTVRALVAGTAVLDGAGTRPILRLEAGPGGLEQTVVLDGLVFANGFSDDEAVAGAVTVTGRRVVFDHCELRDNRAAAPTTGGGALRVSGGAEVEVLASRFVRNLSSNRGGAIAIVDSTVALRDAELLENRVNLPGHATRSVGGAIFQLDGALSVERSRFERNQAGWAGGSIYTFGRWAETNESPVAELRVSWSTFRDNVSRPDPCCPPPGAPEGAALHVEDASRAVVLASVFEDNEAVWGGAISSYRSEIEIFDSAFRRNRVRLDDAFDGAGGAILAVSSDILNATSGFGAINRPAAGLLLRNVLLEGGGSGPDANQGGCLGALGDTNRQFGRNSLPLDADLARNRARVTLDQVVAVSCEAGVGGGSQVLGGALYLQTAALTMSDSLVLRSRASGGAGGGLLMIDASTSEIADSVFADNSSSGLGGAVHASGSELVVRDSAFLRNAVPVGTAVFEQTGAALFVQPSESLGLEASGSVTGSLFAQQSGLDIFEGDAASAPVNRMTYNTNRFVAGPNTKVFLNPLATFSGSSVDQLNALVIQRPGDDTRKVFGANVRLAATPDFGRVVAAPSLQSNLATTLDGALGFAWAGTGATLGDVLSERSGTLAPGAPGIFPLRVDGAEVDRAEITDGRGGGACDDGLCLGDERFLVDLRWTDASGRSDRARVVETLRSDDSGLLWFFQADNWEMLVKALDGCALNGHFWVFVAATTDVGYRLSVTDLATGRVRSYGNAVGNAAPALTDTEAFSCDGSSVGPQVAAGHVGRAVPAVRNGAPSLRSLPARACVSSADALCLQSQRFAVTASWRDFTGQQGAGQVVAGGSSDSGLFWFFDPDNWEMLVKVLDGCAINGNYWVLAAATTDVEYRLQVMDSETGRMASYTNELGNASPAIIDTAAIPCQ